MRIYVDDISVYATAAGTLNSFVPMSAGTHAVVVQAWDAKGTVFKSPGTVTVTAGTEGTNVVAAGVSVSSPSDGSRVGAPVQVVASAAAGAPISAMMIYVDNISVFATAGGNVDTSLSPSPGQHSMVVQAWDATGAVYKKALTITVDSGIPANATTKSEIQNMSGWASCSVCAGAGGAGSAAGFSMLQAQPLSLSGSSAQFNIWGSSPYSNALWWNQLGANNSAANFTYDVDFYLTAPQFAQALEFDVNQSNGSTKFIFGTQCNIRDGGVWDVWNTAGAVWQNTGVPCSVPTANTWHHLTWQFQRNASQTTFIALTLDGSEHFINQTYNAVPVSASEINVAFQMDGDFAQHPYSVWLDNVTLSYW